MIYKILKIEGNDTTIEFEFDNNTTSTQTIANLPIEDNDAFAIALKKYADAYLAGLEVENTPEKETTLTVGESIELVLPEPVVPEVIVEEPVEDLVEVEEEVVFDEEFLNEINTELV
jgi:hypothetical protein